MRIVVFSVLLALMTACQPTRPAVEVTAAPRPALTGIPIRNEAIFRQVVAGRVLQDPRGFIYVYAPDGTIRGDQHGRAIGGNWRWSGDRLCRSVTLGAHKRFSERCVAVSDLGGAISFAGPGADKSISWRMVS